jgi:MFS family permease
LLMRQRIGDDRQGLLRAITIGFLLMTTGVTLLGLAPSLGWALGATLFRGVGTGALWVFSSSILMGLVDNRFRGRVFAFEFASLTFTQSVATLFAGLAVDRLGLEVQQVLLVLGGVGLMMSLLWLLFRRYMPGQLALSV